MKAGFAQSKWRTAARLLCLAIGVALFGQNASAQPVLRVESAQPLDAPELEVGGYLVLKICADAPNRQAALLKSTLVLAGVDLKKIPDAVEPRGACKLDPAAATAEKPAFVLRFLVTYDQKHSSDWAGIFRSRNSEHRASLALTVVGDSAEKIEGVPADKIEYAEAGRSVLLAKLSHAKRNGFILVLMILLAALIAAFASNALRDSGPDPSSYAKGLVADFEKAYAAWLGAQTDGRAAAAAPLAASADRLVAFLSSMKPIAAAKDAASVQDATRNKTFNAEEGWRWLREQSDLIGRAAESLRRPFSLARCQMALWTVLVIGAFMWMFQITNTVTEIPEQLLALIGISGGTLLASVALDKGDGAGQPRVPYVAENPIKDMLSDRDGAALHRIQMMLWTLAMGYVFIAEIINNLVYTTFSTTMLGLMGISSGAYLGFKAVEKKS